MTGKVKDAPTAEVSVREAAGFTTPLPIGSLFDELIADAAVHGSVEAVLSDDEGKGTLQNVPFVIVRAVYRDSSDKGKFVSLETVIGQNVGMYPLDSRVVINDGSTGLFRQFTAYVEAQGWVKLPNLPATGKAGETRWDAPYTEWEWSDELLNSGAVEIRFDEQGLQVTTLDLPRKYLCRKGLRLSPHDKGITTYIA